MAHVHVWIFQKMTPFGKFWECQCGETKIFGQKDFMDQYKGMAIEVNLN
jgi:hypothetical protein